MKGKILLRLALARRYRWPFRNAARCVNHYDTLKGLHLTDAEKSDLVEYLKSL